MTADRQSSEKPRLTWPEALSATLGVLVVVGTLAVLGYDLVAGGESPPAIVLRAEALRETPGGHLVEVIAANQGDETAATVRVTGRLLDSDGAVVETRETTFAYVPAGSERRGGLYFAADPGRYTLLLAAEGYVRP